MKTAKDFRKSIGAADGTFTLFVEQTLRNLQYEEAKPVKKKISFGFVLTAAIMLLTVTALAAGSWGIVSYLEEKGLEPAVYKLAKEIAQEQTPARWVDMTIDEILIDGDKAFLAVTILPKEDNTIVVPRVMKLNEPGGMAVMNNPAYDAEMSVQMYAQSRGYERIIGITPLRGQSLGKINMAVYESLDNGGLRCILEYTYKPESDDFPGKKTWFVWECITVEYREDDITPDHVRISPSTAEHIQAEIPVNISERTRKSQPADVHEVAEQGCSVEYVSMTPLEDGSVQFTMYTDTNLRNVDQFCIFAAALLDAKGNQLCRIDMDMSNLILSGKELWYGAIPAEYAQEALKDQVTIQLQKREGPIWLPKDTHTYTMK